uniref:tudor domain-containing 6 isoform X2 n=1 Tax=Scatophagus argus TaxID=75038 RepID=UPI001ED80C8A|nr:tudor domain-containing 6 isoform X2 [Scatophagus argus]
MSSVLGLPARGTDVTILITKVHLHPLCSLVEFWGKFSQERTADYERLANDIQSPGNTFQEFEGNPGDLCLVQIDGTWNRSRIVSRNGPKYTVFLIDKTVTHSTSASNLAQGKKKYFHLPPEVEYCVLANVLPLSPENRWSPMALEFLRSLSGKSVKAHVQDVLIAHRTFLLHIPCISKRMFEVGFAKWLSPNVFQDLYLMLLQSHIEVSPESRQISIGADEQLNNQEFFMYPELPAGIVETVIVMNVNDPQCIFCQLKVFSKDLEKLSEQIRQCCENSMTNCIVGPKMIGFPCAARGSDGRWYRSVLQQVFPISKVVEVLKVDYGTKEFVQVKNVRPLAAEFFRVPVVTYACSLYGITDKRAEWTSSQIDYLRTLVLYKTVIAKFEYQSTSEGVHYVTLYGDENTNINSLFVSKESCLLEWKKTLGDFAIQSTANLPQHPAQARTPYVEGKEDKGRVEKLPVEDLSLRSSHTAVVQYIRDPSEFWVRTQNYANELDKLDRIYHLCKDSVNKDVVRNPPVGLYCLAKAEDGVFYRATVVEVGETQIKVFFVDYGNTEVVDRSNIKNLPDDFRKLPCLAVKCTLAGIRPKDGRWSQNACEFFIKAVTDKTLNVRVIAKYDESYVVQLTDPKVKGEKDLSTLMWFSGLAERTETKRQPKAKMTMQPTILPTQPPHARLSGVYMNNEMSFQTPNTVGPASNRRRIPTFKELMFPIGSVFEVIVSHIESPNDFWCQLVQNAENLKFLMHNIQTHYASSEFQPLEEGACVARHPDNGIWYRALVIHKHEAPHVDVLFVDYGQKETVSLYDLRRISPEYLTLQGQAIRCSLLNHVDPTSVTNEWNAEAIGRFHSLVETAAFNFGILKCTIYAVMCSEQMTVFNIVDLETPFESISTSMVSLFKPPKKDNGPFFHLNTYYYSAHKIKLGTEEQVTVTSVNSVSQFYCQFQRNADMIKDLKIKVNSLCQQLENIKVPAVFGTLCFAKYTDGQWYRGEIKAMKPAILVHFVDYGDTVEVEKSNLLPVPREAADIISVPIQAIMCSLSGVPADVPSEVNRWFATSVTQCKFQALVVAREPNGKMQVELYHGKTQINSKLAKKFQIQMYADEMYSKVVCQVPRALETSANLTQKPRKAVPKQAREMKDHTQTIQNGVSAPKSAHHMKDADMNLQSALKPLHKKVKAPPLKLYEPPPQRQSFGRTPDAMANKAEGDYVHVEKLPKLADLPSRSITSGMKADVYVSHCKNPLSFYVQLVREEDELFSLVEKLNDPQSNPHTDDIKQVHPGDLVQAEWMCDYSWYRAVVREIDSNTMALVEFVDFGNTAVIPFSKIGRLDKDSLQFPMYSTCCMLSDAAALGKEEVLDPKVTSAFKEDVGANGEKVLKCHFIRQSGSMWEVSLEDNGVNVTCKVPSGCSADCSEKNERTAWSSDIRQVPEKSVPNSRSLLYKQQEFLEGQKFEVYVTTVNDTQTFWCQPAFSEELVKIISSLSEVGDAADQKPLDPGLLSPGSPCVALFSDNHLWYRAEVISKDENKVSVLFVDYGNISQVSVTDVREMPADLMEIPPQAFLCELEGCDASRGSWDSGVVDELSVLTADKVLQLTVTRLTKEEGKIKCFVQMKVEGRLINEALKTWWKNSTPENKPDAVGQTTSYKPPLLCDPAVKESAPRLDQLEYPDSEEMDNAVACICSEGKDAGELVDPQTGDEISGLTSCSTHSNNSEDYLQSSVESPEAERDQVLSECDMTTAPQMLRMTESLRESVSDEGVSIFGPDPLNSPLDENPNKDINESKISVTESESPPGEENTCMNFSDPKEQRDDSKFAFLEDNAPRNMTTVKMVPRGAFRPTIAKISEDLKQSDLMAEEETMAQHEVTDSALLADSGTAASEPHTCIAPSQDLGGEVEDLSCSVEEACLADVYTDLNEPGDDSEVTSAGANCLSIRTAAEMVQKEPLLSCRIPPHGQLIGADYNLLVCKLDHDSSLYAPPDSEADMEDSEQLVYSSSKQTENFRNGVAKEEMSSCADDSFEAQLTKITPLSVISDGSADVVPVEQQPEE